MSAINSGLATVLSFTSSRRRKISPLIQVAAASLLSLCLVQQLHTSEAFRGGSSLFAITVKTSHERSSRTTEISSCGSRTRLRWPSKTQSGPRSRHRYYSSRNEDDWFGEFDDQNAGNDGDDDNEKRPEDPRVASMRSLLESSWDGKSMGVVPSDPEKSAEAAAECVAATLAAGNNMAMIDLRLPSYDISEGKKFYDIVAAYDFCAYLSDRLRERGLVRKSLVLVRNEDERSEVYRAVSRREKKPARVEEVEAVESAKEEEDDEWALSGESLSTDGGSADNDSSDVDAFRKQLMSSWESDATEVTVDASEENISPNPTPSVAVPITKADDTTSSSAGESHRLWSVLGDDEISSGTDMFTDVIEAVDKHAILVDSEDALIILSPYDTADLIGIRRIIARYGMTRTIIVVNSRMETLPQELNPAVLAYGLLPLVARAKGSGDAAGGDDGEAGPKVVVMKRFPKDWEVFVDVDGDGFVDVTDEGRSYPLGSGASKEIPPMEWIVSKVEAHAQKRFGR